MPDQPGRFLCKSSDLLRLTAKDGDQRQRREFEANRFDTLMLMPSHLLRAVMAAFCEPDLQNVLLLARDFAVGRETAARAYVQHRPERIAVAAAGNGHVQRAAISEQRAASSEQEGERDEGLDDQASFMQAP